MIGGYTLTSAAAVLVVVTADLVAFRTVLVRRKVFWVSYAIVLLFQLALDGVLTGRGIVRFDPSAILGPRVLNAPVEDLLFGFALVLFTLSTWTWLGRRGVDR